MPLAHAWGIGVEYASQLTVLAPTGQARCLRAARPQLRAAVRPAHACDREDGPPGACSSSAVQRMLPALQSQHASPQKHARLLRLPQPALPTAVAWGLPTSTGS
eukprot:COSAG05_NODE_1347_length_5118_cov_5.195258_2_plen_104_part_00